MDKLSVNPYVCLNRYKITDYVKFVLGTPLVIIRLIIGVICILCLYITALIAYLILVIHKPKEHYSVKKYYLCVPLAFFRLSLFCLGFYWISVKDQSKKVNQTTCEAPIIILLPHTSIYDLLAVSFLRHVTCVARSQVKDVPILSTIAELGNPILVQREEPASRQKVIEIIKERAKKEQVLILPEGTCSNRELLLQFKTGAFKPGLAVQPYVIDYNCDDLCFKGIDHTSWVREGPPVLLSMWMTASKLWTSMRITKMPVYVPNESEKRDALLYASNVQKFISSLSGLRFSHYSYDDNKFLSFCYNKNIPRSPPCIRFVRLCHRMSIANSKKQISKQSKGIDKFDREVEVGFSGKESLYRTHSEEETITGLILVSTLDRIFEKLNPKDIQTFQLSTKEDIINIFGLPAMHPSDLNSTTIDDFLVTLQQIRSDVQLYFIIILTLCDLRITSLWRRIEICVRMLLANTGNNNSLTITQFQQFIWCLLGIERNDFDDTYFRDVTIDFAYIRRHLVTVFERPVQENAESLIDEIDEPSFVL